jgi:tRNA U38,U39,U40 pseudouridine synthase TruA
MIGAAVLVGRGILPLEAVDVALTVPVRVQLPLAPAQGLVLVHAGFGRNSNGQVQLEGHTG